MPPHLLMGLGLAGWLCAAEPAALGPPTASGCAIRADAGSALIEVPQADLAPWGRYAAWPGPTLLAQEVAVVRLRISGRAADGGPARLLVTVTDRPGGGDPWVSRMVRAGDDPVEVELPFAAGSASQAHVVLSLAFAAQTVSVAEVGLVRHGRGVQAADLPSRADALPWRQADARWRADALDRIDRQRTAPLTVVVRDGQGERLANARVEIQQLRHGFGFIAGVESGAILGDRADGERLRGALAAHRFNGAAIQSALAWTRIERPDPHAERMVAKLREAGLDVHGHALVWPAAAGAWRAYPAEIDGLAGRPDELAQRVAERIVGAVAALRGQMAVWDILHEPTSGRSTFASVGPATVSDWLRLARSADPAARLVVADRILPWTDADDRPRRFAALVGELAARKAPLDAIGVQLHQIRELADPRELTLALDRLAEHGLPIVVTGLQVDAGWDRALQADQMRDLLIACVAHPAVRAVTVWGLWEAEHWRPQAAWYDRAWNARPVVDAWDGLVGGRWWTRAAADTNADGACTVRVFKGRHRVAVRAPAFTIEREIAVEDATQIEIRP